MLIDPHAHTRGISHCCRAEAEEVLETAKAHGFDGLVLTNHYTENYYTDETYHEWIERYIEEWHRVCALAEQKGLRAFFGIEVTQEYEPRLHMLVYGCDEDFLRTNQRLCELSLEELSAVCHAHGCALVQAHPFRNGATVQDTAYLDGLEINCHPKYGSTHASEVELEAKKAGLALICGCDYHADTYRAHGGTLVPDGIKTGRELAQYLLHADRFTLQVHEVSDGAIYTKEYTRT